MAKRFAAKHWQIGDTVYYDYEAVTYRVDPKDSAVAGFHGDGRVTIEMKGRKIEIVTTIDASPARRISTSAPTEKFPETSSKLVEEDHFPQSTRSESYPAHKPLR